MPMPKPHKGEQEKEFVSRFMGDDAMVKEFPKNKQRLAVAYSTWRAKHEDVATATKLSQVVLKFEDDDWAEDAVGALVGYGYKVKQHADTVKVIGLGLKTGLTDGNIEQLHRTLKGFNFTIESQNVIHEDLEESIRDMSFIESSVYEHILSELDENNIDYAITGGFAVAYFYPDRSTQDMDVMVKHSDFEKAIDLFKDHDGTRLTHAYEINIGGTHVDLVPASPKMEFMVDGRVLGRFKGLDAYMVSSDHLIAQKIYSSTSPWRAPGKIKQDQADVINMSYSVPVKREEVLNALGHLDISGSYAESLMNELVDPFTPFREDTTDVEAAVNQVSEGLDIEELLDRWIR